MNKYAFVVCKMDIDDTHTHDVTLDTILTLWVAALFLARDSSPHLLVTLA